VLVGVVVVGCGDGGGAGPRCGDGHVDPGEECDNGAFNGFDQVCTTGCRKLIQHTTLTANVGIDRGIVPEYEGGDACGSVARTLVIDGTDPNGAPLPHQEVDCTQGYNGWPFYDVAPGTFTLSMLLKDDAGNAITPAKTGTGTVLAGSNTVVWVDFAYTDFSATYTGNLRWQTDWVNMVVPDGGLGDAGVTGPGVACAAALPPIAKVRLTLRNDQGLVVNDTASFKTGTATITTPTNGSAKVDCHDYATSDAEVVKNLPWGVYSLRVEGYDAGGQLAFCAARDVFTPKGEGIIFHAHGAPGACP
jgi:hypothetical protein